MDLNEKSQELVYTQAEISIKDLKEILNNHDEKETILVNFLRGTSVIDLKILHPTMMAQISTKSIKIEGTCGDGEGLCSKSCEIYDKCKGENGVFA